MHAYVFPRTVSSGIVIAGSDRRLFAPSWRRLEAEARRLLHVEWPDRVVGQVTREVVNGRRAVWLNYSSPFSTGR